MSCKMQINSYLASCIEIGQKSDQLIIVMGNEACDLDSMVCATVLAYYLSSTPEQSLPVIPLLNIAREDVSLRREAAWCFEQSGIILDSIPTTSEIDLLAKQKSGSLRLVLVDHHRLRIDQLILAETIDFVIDHHSRDNTDHLLPCEDKLVIERVGSCASLVTRYIRNKSSQFFPREPSCCLLLYAAILLDTRELKDISITCETDRQQAQYLSDLVTVQSDFVTELYERRASIKDFTFCELLRKDAKSIFCANHSKVHLGSIPRRLSDISNSMHLSVQQLSDEMIQFASQQHIDLVLIGTTYMLNSVFCRELLMFGNSRMIEQLINHLKLNSPSLLYEMKGIPEVLLKNKQVALFDTINNFSRKKLLPLVQDCFKE